MFNEYKYKIELHAHTSPVSACSQIAPEKLAEIYSGLGCDAVVVTNHFNPELHRRFGDDVEGALDFYMSGYEQTRAAAEPLGMRVLFGMEVRVAENMNDYLVFGADRELAREIYPYLTKTVAELRQNVDFSRSVFLQAHPFRDGMTRVDPALLDGIEVFNLHPGHNSRIGVAAKYAHDQGFIATGGTDYHHFGHEGLGFTMTRSLPSNSFELAELLLSRDFIFQIGDFTAIRN